MNRLGRVSRAGTNANSRALSYKVHKDIGNLILAAPTEIKLSFLRKVLYEAIWLSPAGKEQTQEMEEFVISLRETMIDSIIEDPETWGFINEDLMLTETLSKFIKDAQ